MEEGYYSIFGVAGARTEMPGCSLCMGNQARVADKATVVLTSTRNFPNRLGQGANVYLASAELAAIAENMESYKALSAKKDETYRYLNFDQYDDYTSKAKDIEIDADVKDSAKKNYAAFIA